MTRFALLAATAVLATAPLAAAPTTKAPEFVKMAGASDLYEKTSSQVVLEDAKDPKLRDYAKMMINDHTQSTNDVVAAAKSDGLTPAPPKLMPKQEKMIADLRKAKGPAREKLYVKQQQMAHQEALALHTTYSKSGDKPALTAAAGKIAPVVQHHLDEVRAMGAM